MAAAVEQKSAGSQIAVKTTLEDYVTEPACRAESLTFQTEEAKSAPRCSHFIGARF
jgi:hypothetical protein